MFHNQSGQVGLNWIVGIGASLALAFAGSLMTQSNMFNSKVDGVKTDIGLTNQRVSTMEEAIFTLKGDNKEIKDKLDKILFKLK